MLQEYLKRSVKMHKLNDNRTNLTGKNDLCCLNATSVNGMQLSILFLGSLLLPRLTSVSDSIVYTEFMPFGILLDINHTC